MRIKYKCAKCGKWEASLVKEWTDIKPSKCMNKQCKTNFIAEPQALLIELPQKEEVKLPNKKKKQDNGEE